MPPIDPTVALASVRGRNVSRLDDFQSGYFHRPVHPDRPVLPYSDMQGAKMQERSHCLWFHFGSNLLEVSFFLQLLQRSA